MLHRLIAILAICLPALSAIQEKPSFNSWNHFRRYKYQRFRKLASGKTNCIRVRSMPPDIPKMAYKNLEKILVGYNIYKGSPYAKQDEGWSPGQLFEFDWTRVKTDSNGRQYPYDVNVQQMSLCSTDVSTSIQSSSRQLQKSFSSDVSVSASASYFMFSGSFTASSSYQKTSDVYTSNQYSTGVAMAKCAFFKASLKRVQLPCMSAELIKWIDVLVKDRFHTQRLNQFFDNFGTHAVLSHDFGSLFVSRAKFKSSLYRSTETESKTLAFSATGKASGLGWSVSVTASASTTDSKTETKSSSSQFSSVQIYTLGLPLITQQEVSKITGIPLANVTYQN